MSCQHLGFWFSFSDSTCKLYTWTRQKHDSLIKFPAPVIKIHGRAAEQAHSQIFIDKEKNSNKYV